VRVIDVAIDPRSGGAEGVYTYRADEPYAVGQAVIVPLGNRTAIGYVTQEREANEEQLGFPIKALKPPTASVSGISLPPALVELTRFVSEEYLCSLTTAMAPAVPPGARDRLVTSWSVADPFPEAPPLSALQKEVLRHMREEGGILRETKAKPLSASTVRALKQMRIKGVVQHKLEVSPFDDRKSGEKLLRVAADDKKIEDFLHKEGKKKPAQALTLMRLQATEHSALSAAEIKALAGVTDSTLKALLTAGLLEEVDPHLHAASAPPTPNQYQKLAIEAVSDAIISKEFRPFLLFGITGSGKTEVFLRSAAEALRAGRQVLYIVPEIALAAQGIARLRDRFGSRVAVLHSDLAASERLKNWLKVRHGEASVVLGARSALFAPLDNLGLIVVDEEHEASYKQESAPRYHSKRLAMFLGRLHSCPVVLGSATPSVESFYEAEQEKLTLLSIPERAASANLPTVFVDDLGAGYRAGNPMMLGNMLTVKLEETLQRGEQVILFLNRRAYAPFIICRDCGFQAHCPNCAVSLSYHRRDRRLRCHHCGYQSSPPDACPKCGGLKLSPFGVGTEKVEEVVAETFPDAVVARLDRDVTKKKGALEEVLAKFRSGDTHILVGTQMVAKGLDFPNVTLVGVIAADISLNIPDFRAAERTFQLLAQVAGRAGRGLAPGQVVIQTFNPFHPSVACAQTHDYVAFYEQAIRERKQAAYPPFRRLVNVTLTGPSRAEVNSASTEAADRLRQDSDIEVLGPVDCAIERIQNRWRRHVLAKLPPEMAIITIHDIFSGFSPKGVQVVIDADPYTLM
jgi:primosomal protein N' (replication factor Y)